MWSVILAKTQTVIKEMEMEENYRAGSSSLEGVRESMAGEERWLIRRNGRTRDDREESGVGDRERNRTKDSRVSRRNFLSGYAHTQMQEF